MQKLRIFLVSNHEWLTKNDSEKYNLKNNFVSKIRFKTHLGNNGVVFSRIPRHVTVKERWHVSFWDSQEGLKADARLKALKARTQVS